VNLLDGQVSYGILKIMWFLMDDFSLSTLPSFTREAVLRVKKLTLEEVKELLKDGLYVSIIRHKAIAKLFQELFGIVVRTNAITITFDEGDRIIVAQIQGVKLEEGQTLNHEELKRLYEEGRITFYEVYIQYIFKNYSLGG